MTTFTDEAISTEEMQIDLIEMVAELAQYDAVVAAYDVLIKSTVVSSPTKMIHRQMRRSYSNEAELKRETIAVLRMALKARGVEA